MLCLSRIPNHNFGCVILFETLGEPYYNKYFSPDFSFILSVPLCGFFSNHCFQDSKPCYVVFIEVLYRKWVDPWHAYLCQDGKPKIGKSSLKNPMQIKTFKENERRTEWKVCTNKS